MEGTRGRRNSFSDPKKREEARQHEEAQLRAQMLQRKDSIGNIEKALLEAQQAGDAGSDELSSRLRAAETELRKGLDHQVDDHTLQSGLVKLSELDDTLQARRRAEAEAARAESEAKESALAEQAEAEKEARRMGPLLSKLKSGTLEGCLVKLSYLSGEYEKLNGKIGRVVSRDAFDGAAQFSLAMQAAKRNQAQDVSDGAEVLRAAGESPLAFRPLIIISFSGGGLPPEPPLQLGPLGRPRPACVNRFWSSVPSCARAQPPPARG